MLTARTATVAAALVLALAGCSSDDEPDPGPTTPDVEVPEGITLTSGGSTVSIGEPASVIYRPQDAARTIITVEVDKITRGKPADLDGYDVDGVPPGSLPYYVDASVRNDGPAALADAAVPLYGLDSGDSYFRPLDVTGPVGGCAPLRLDDNLAPGSVSKGCLVFAVPPKRTFKAVQVRTSDLSRPVTWKP